jgi:hypothetical protein
VSFVSLPWLRHHHCRFRQLARVVPRETLGLRVPDLMMATLGAALPHEGVVLGQVLAGMV